MYSEPTFDPNPLASHDLETERTVFNALADDPNNPALARAWRERYPPGSTFKIVTTAIALDAGVVTPDKEYPELEELDVPQTDRNLQNFGGNRCGGTVAVSFRNSCNTTFAKIGLEMGEIFADGLERFGINTAPPPADLNPRVARSVGPEKGSFELDQPSFAQAAIGQADVAITPIENAMIAAAVANNGVMMVPHVGAEIRNADGEVIDRISPRRWKRSMTPATAAAIQAMMIDVVQNGTGSAAQIPGVTVAGKTGTAQVAGAAPHAWFVAYAPADAAPGQPQYAVAVLVEGGGDLGNEATGGRVAAPIAAEVLQVLLGVQG
jgi:peptidoglycan glycosyltransferase